MANRINQLRIRIICTNYNWAPGLGLVPFYITIDGMGHGPRAWQAVVAGLVYMACGNHYTGIAFAPSVSAI